jgi:hypothetical protein
MGKEENTRRKPAIIRGKKLDKRGKSLSSGWGKEKNLCTRRKPAIIRGKNWIKRGKS